MRTLSHLLLCLSLVAGCDIGSKDDDGGGDGWGEEDGSATGGAEDGSTEDSGSADGGSEDGGSTGGSTGGATGGSTSDCTDYTMSLVEGVWFYPAVVRVALRLQCDGLPVPEKTEEDFSIFEDGTEVSSFESNFMIVPTVSALRLASLMLIDMSGSIVETGSLPTLQLAALSFIDKLGSDHEVAIYLFDGRDYLELLQPLTSDHDALSAAIGSLDTYETYDTSTNLNGAIIAGIDLLDGFVTAETDSMIDTSMVVFTDGTDMASYHTNAEAALAVTASDHAVYSVSLGSDIDAEHMASVGRDGHYSADNLEGLEDAFNEVGERINNAAKSVYIMAYCSPRRSGEHELELKLNGTSTSVTLPFDADGFGAGCSSEDFLPAEFLDLDEDGYRPYDGDCDDDDADVFPGAVEEATDFECMQDTDGDGYGDPDPPYGYDEGTDCDDENASVFPGSVDEASDTECMDDTDGDGYGDESPPYGYVEGSDCDDTDDTVYPGAIETADGTDDDCDDVIDEGTDVYDDDGDGLSEDEGDCDDSDMFSTTTEEDADCDGVVDAVGGDTAGSGSASGGGTSAGDMTDGGGETGDTTGGSETGDTTGGSETGDTTGGSETGDDEDAIGGCISSWGGFCSATTEADCGALSGGFFSYTWDPDGCPGDDDGSTDSSGSGGDTTGGGTTGGDTTGGGTSGSDWDAAACAAAGGIPSYVGDGFCDDSSNIAACGYDGGDCCPSTCVDSYYECGEAGWWCIDPAVTGGS